jgi:hypothetical protein
MWHGKLRSAVHVKDKCGSRLVSGMDHPVFSSEDLLTSPVGLKLPGPIVNGRIPRK